MSEYVIQGQTLTGIADAIRAQLETEQQYTPETMAAAIGSIQGGGAEQYISLLSGTLEVFDDAALVNLNSRAFQGNKGIKDLYFRGLKIASDNQLSSMNNLVKAYCPVLTNMQYALFQSCPKLQTVYCGTVVIQITESVFLNNSSLSCLILAGGYKTALANLNAFTGTPIASGTGYIYVPDDLVEQYKVATNWAIYASQIKGLSEIPTEVQEWLDQQGGASA